MNRHLKKAIKGFCADTGVELETDKCFGLLSDNPLKTWNGLVFALHDYLDFDNFLEFGEMFQDANFETEKRGIKTLLYFKDINWD